MKKVEMIEQRRENRRSLKVRVIRRQQIHIYELEVLSNVVEGR
jgi:hypothetical protein